MSGRESAVETIVSFAPRTARLVCPECRTSAIAIGSTPRTVAFETAIQHDAECAQLRQVAQLLTVRADDPAELAAAEAAIHACVEAGLARIRQAAA